MLAHWARSRRHQRTASRDIGLDPPRWQLLLERLADFAPGPDAALAALEAAEPQFIDKADRTALWTSLRGVLHNHRQFPGAEWSLSEGVLTRLEAIYRRFAPTDPLERIAWLFESAVGFPQSVARGLAGSRARRRCGRQQAAAALYAERGVDDVLALARLVSAAGYIGKALFDAGVAEADLDSVLEAALRSDEATSATWRMA